MVDEKRIDCAGRQRLAAMTADRSTALYEIGL